MGGPAYSAPRGRSASAVFVGVVTAYFAAQIALRLILGGALETDEAEMMVMTPGLQMGYGPQLPLYNWLQIGLFAIFGKTLFSLALLKNLLLWLTYVLVFAGFRLWMPASLAAVGAVSLFALPDVAWEAQRATTHSNMLLATSAATLAAFLWVLKAGRWPAYLALGLALGLGGLAKYNFWLVPLSLFAAGLTLPALRPRLLTMRSVVAWAIAAMMLGPPYRWMLANPALAFSSTGKLSLGGAASAASGLGALMESMVALAVLPVLVAGGLYLANRGGRTSDGPRADAAIPRLLWRASLVAAVAVSVAVPVAGVGHVTPRWLLPLFFLAVPALFITVFGRLGGRGIRGLAVVLAVFAVLVMVGLTYDRLKPTGRRAVSFDALPAELSRQADMAATPVVAEFFVAGNLARARPEWRVAPYLAFAASEFAGQTVMFLFRQGIPAALADGMRQAGWPAGARAEVLKEGRITLPYDSSDETALSVGFILVRTPALP